MKLELKTIAFAVICASACSNKAQQLAEEQRKIEDKTAASHISDSHHVAPSIAAKLNIDVATAEEKPLARKLELVGAVEFDQDKLAIVGPRLAGRVIKLGARLGDIVHAGSVLAEIESVELARAAADYLSAKARAKAARSNAERESELAQRNVSSIRDKEFAVAEAQALDAQVDAAEQLLIALGLSRDELPKGGDARPLSRYRLRSPMNGLIVERDAVLGEAVDLGRTLYKVADLGHVWVKLDVYERDLTWVRPGLVAELRTEGQGSLGRASVSYVEPEIDQETRTARVHLDFSNLKAHLRPGQFVSAAMRSEGSGTLALTVPRSAVQSIDNKDIVFVRMADGGFVVRPIKTGRMAGDTVEVRDGLHKGEQVATTNAFLLKSEVLR